MSHTKEPWHCFNDEVMDEQERTIAHILTSGYEMESYTAKDARRIVACVNACAGIPTESLEAGMFDDPIVRSTIAALEAKVRELEAELQRRAKQIGVACMKHDLTHSLACGHCYAESRHQVERLVEALITIDQKLEAAVLCEAKTGKLMPASPLRIDVYKAFAAIDQECNG